MKFIWTEKETRNNLYVRFEGIFELASKTENIIAHIGTSGEYVLYINSSVADFGQFADWHNVITFNKRDISNACEVGRNDFVLVVWHPNLNCMVSVKKQARAAFEIIQGAKTLFESDENTICREETRYTSGDLPLITPQLGYTFEYDSKKELPEVKSAVTVPAPDEIRERATALLEFGDTLIGKQFEQGLLYAYDKRAENSIRIMRDGLSFRTVRELSSETASADGRYYIFDMGKECAGYPSFDFEVSEDCEVLLAWGEHLIDGRVRAHVGGRNFTCRYYAKKGVNTFTHYLKRWGCRYIEIHVYSSASKINSVSITPVMYPVERINKIDTGNVLHDKIYQVCIDTLRCCMHDHYEDCPWREQALYAMDSRIQILAGYYTFGEFRLPRASLKLLSEGQRPDGQLEICAPAYFGLAIPSFTFAFIIEACDYLEYSKDRDFMREILPVIDRIFESFTVNVDPDGVAWSLEGDENWNFYEWMDGMDGTPIGVSQTKRKDGILTAWYAYALKKYIGALKTLDIDHEKYETAYNKTVDALELFYDENVHAYAGAIVDNKKQLYSEYGQALTLLAGACDEKRAATIRDRLKTNDDLIHATLSNQLLRYEALMTDRSNLTFVMDDIAKIWGKMLYDGATSFYETAEGAGDFDRAGSLCHGWSAVPAIIYHKYLK